MKSLRCTLLGSEVKHGGLDCPVVLKRKGTVNPGPGFDRIQLALNNAASETGEVYWVVVTISPRSSLIFGASQPNLPADQCVEPKRVTFLTGNVVDELELIVSDKDTGERHRLAIEFEAIRCELPQVA